MAGIKRFQQILLLKRVVVDADCYCKSFVEFMGVGTGLSIVSL